MSNETAAPTSAPKSSRRFVVPIVAVTLVLLLGGGGAAYWLRASPEDGVPAATVEEEAGPEMVVDFETFVVNLADPGGRRFLRATLSLVVEAEEAGHGDEDAVTMMRVRSSILDLLALQTADRLITPEGKAALKVAITHAVAGAAGDLHVTDVLFSEFIVQF